MLTQTANDAQSALRREHYPTVPPSVQHELDITGTLPLSRSLQRSGLIRARFLVSLALMRKAISVVTLLSAPSPHSA